MIWFSSVFWIILHANTADATSPTHTTPRSMQRCVNPCVQVCSFAGAWSVVSEILGGDVLTPCGNKRDHPKYFSDHTCPLFSALSLVTTASVYNQKPAFSFCFAALLRVIDPHEFCTISQRREGFVFGFVCRHSSTYPCYGTVLFYCDGLMRCVADTPASIPLFLDSTAVQDSGLVR